MQVFFFFVIVYFMSIQARFFDTSRKFGKVDCIVLTIQSVQVNNEPNKYK